MTNKICIIQVATGFFTCVCLSIGAVSQVPEGEFTWRGKIASGGVAEIIGIKGDIRVETSPVQEVEVVAVKQGNQNEFELVSTRVEESGGRIRICAAFPKLGGGGSECVDGLEWPGTSFQNKEIHIWHESRKKQSFRMVDVRVQLTIRIPAGVGLVVRSLSDDVSANFGLTGFSSPIDLKSINGNVTLTLPQPVHAQVRMETMNGSIATEFPITVLGGFAGRGFEGTVGQGGPKITLSSINGNVQLRRAK